MVPFFGFQIRYETFIGLSAYMTMGIFCLSATLIYDWPDIKRAFPFLKRIFGKKGVISDEVALASFWVFLIAGWVATAIIVDLLFV